MGIADALAPSLLPKYYIGVETRTYLEGTDEELLMGIADAIVLSATGQSQTPTPIASPAVATQARPQTVVLPMPVEVKQRYLEIREAGSDAVITVIEVLSPTNKRKGTGRTAYEKKRQQILASASHLVEIDLLRGDQPMAMQGNNPAMDYRTLVSRSENRPRVDLYGFTLREANSSVSPATERGDRGSDSGFCRRSPREFTIAVATASGLITNSLCRPLHYRQQINLG